jgi:hypothetical protein
MACRFVIQNIQCIFGHKIKKFETNKVVTESGEFPADLILFMPGMTGNQWFDNTELARSEGGLLKADKYRAPGFSAGVKNVRLNLSRRFSCRSCVSRPNKNSNIGPPRIALGSFGLPEKPMAILPASISLSLSRIFSTLLNPSQGVMAFSIPTQHNNASWS